MNHPWKRLLRRIRARASGGPRGLTIGIHPDRVAEESWSDVWTDYFRSRDVRVLELDLLADDAFERVADCDGVMWRWIHTWQAKQSAGVVLKSLEIGLGKPVYPDLATSWHYDDKVAQARLLADLRVPTPRTWVFWNLADAIAWADVATYPVVFKLAVGAGASNVLLVRDREAAVHLANRMFKGGIYPYTMNEFDSDRDGPTDPHFKPEFDYAYFQEFVPDNEFDTRITVIGDRAFGFRRFNRPGDFRASGSGLVDFDVSKIDPRCVRMAFEISKRCGWQSMAFDFLFRDGVPLVNEVSYTFWDRLVRECPGHWRSDGTMVRGNLAPQIAIAEDFLVKINASGVRSRRSAVSR